jgi:hypothetical protein
MVEAIGGWGERIMADETALETYRYLRGGIPVMLAMLFAAIVIERVPASCWQSSISAYYFTAVHAVFIGAICAIGAMLIVYKGLVPTEDVLLNVAGVLGFVVAFVPTSKPAVLCGVSDPAVDVVGAAVIANAWALVVTLVVARVTLWVIHRRTNTEPRHRNRTIATWVVRTQRVLLVAGVAALAFAPEEFVSHAHEIAAFSMFAAIIGTVFITGFLAKEDVVPSANPPLYHRIYQVIAWIMVATLGLALLVHFTLTDFKLLVLGVEVVLLLEFAVYWAVQTVEKWNLLSAVPSTPPQDEELDAPPQQPPSYTEDSRAWLLNNL